MKPIKRLSGDALFVNSQFYDWGGPDGHYEDFTDDRLRVHQADRCSECGQIVYDVGYQEEAKHNEIDADSRCQGWVHGGGVPMMNYRYSLPNAPRDLHAAQKALLNLPLTIVEDTDTDEWYLALTGGGMNLSWEICDAFMRLGYLPPVHFADLPGMADRGTSRRDRWIVAGCRAAFRGAIKSLQNDRKSLDATVLRERKRQAANKIADARRAAAEAAYTAFVFERPVVEADGWEYNNPTDRWYRTVHFVPRFSEAWTREQSRYLVVHFESDLSTTVTGVEAKLKPW